jgi:hypothetical protein
MMTTEREKNRQHRAGSVVALSMFGLDWRRTLPILSSYLREAKLGRNLHEKFWDVGGLPWERGGMSA